METFIKLEGVIIYMSGLKSKVDVRHSVRLSDHNFFLWLQKKHDHFADRTMEGTLKRLLKFKGEKKNGV